MSVRPILVSGIKFDTSPRKTILSLSNVMAENMPNAPGGAVPPKKETGKVQPKKETVRINLPPKPTAAPTIKLPTLPPGGPSGPGAAPMAPAPAAHAAPAAALRAAAAPAAAPRLASTPGPVTRSMAPVAPAARTVSGLDTGLAVAAMILALAAAGTTAYLAFMLPT
jgi:hypothetical protein